MDGPRNAPDGEGRRRDDAVPDVAGSPVERAFTAYLAQVAADADRLREQAAASLVTAARQAHDLGWSQRRTAQALGRSQPEVARLLGRVDLLPAPTQEVQEPSTLTRVLRDHREQIIEVAARHGAHNVRVFGSVARGEDDEQSDVDLLVDLDAGIGLFGLGRLEAALEALLGCSVDVVPERALRPRVAQTVEAVPL